jgi:hypothetical protein
MILIIEIAIGIVLGHLAVRKLPSIAAAGKNSIRAIRKHSDMLFIFLIAVPAIALLVSTGHGWFAGLAMAVLLASVRADLAAKNQASSKSALSPASERP